MSIFIFLSTHFSFARKALIILIMIFCLSALSIKRVLSYQSVNHNQPLKCLQYFLMWRKILYFRLLHHQSSASRKFYFKGRAGNINPKADHFKSFYKPMEVLSVKRDCSKNKKTSLLQSWECIPLDALLCHVRRAQFDMNQSFWQESFLCEILYGS